MDSLPTTFADSNAGTRASAAPAMRPRDAASLIVVDPTPAEPKVLMGRRRGDLAFMPGKLVFPGGRTDATDGRIRLAADLDPHEQTRLAASSPRTSAARLRAIAASALREAYEEAGILIGRHGNFVTLLPGWQGFTQHGVQPSAAPLRLLARAITPPGLVRRFDARFFVCWRDAIALTLPQGGPDGELEELAWLGIDEALALEVAGITALILGDLRERLRCDPGLTSGQPIPIYRHLRNRTVRGML